jgi:hypothetical protein
MTTLNAASLSWDDADQSLKELNPAILRASERKGHCNVQPDGKAIRPKDTRIAFGDYCEHDRAFV